MGVLVPLVARAGVLAKEAAGQADGFEVIWTWCAAAAGGAALRPWSRVVRILAGGHTAVARLIADSPFLATARIRDAIRPGDDADRGD